VVWVMSCLQVGMSQRRAPSHGIAGSMPGRQALDFKRIFKSSPVMRLKFRQN
jgi:hypothetical protein